jgi:capsular exopolysaccharide synthesis family protein
MTSSESPSALRYGLHLLQRHWRPATSVFSCIFLLAVVVIMMEKPLYTAEGKIKFTRTNAAASLTGLGKDVGNLEPLAQQTNPRMTEAEVIRSEPVVSHVIRQLDLKDEKGQPLRYAAFLRRLTLSDLRGTDVLKVSFQDTDSSSAANIVNALMDAYLKNTVQTHRSQIASTRQFTERQLPSVEATVRSAEEDLRKFREANQVISLKEESTATVATLARLQQEITAASVQLRDTDAKIRVTQDQLGMTAREALAATALSQSSGVQSSLQAMQQVETDLAGARSQFKENHPKVLDLEDKLANLRQVMQSRSEQVLRVGLPIPAEQLQLGALQQDLTKQLAGLESQRQGIVNQLTELAQAQVAYRDRMKQLPQLEERQRELERRLEAAQSTYSQLLQRIGEMRVAENQAVSNAQVISQALEPEGALSRNPRYLAAGLLGLLMAGATAWLLEKRDQSLQTSDQAQQVFGYTLLGMIPSTGTTKSRPSDEALEHLVGEVVVQDGMTSAAGAAYRMLQTNLTFLSSDKRPRLITVTSSTAKEGKSTIAANLAMAMALSGRRVLLVDADMHNPSQHRIWLRSNDLGLSNVLVNQSSFRIAIQGVMPNLDLLSSGVMPPNSLALLDSQRMATLMAEFEAHYDFVIIDTPALDSVADGIVLGKMADGVLLVVRPGWLDLSSASFAKELLTQSNQTILGMVLNDVPVDKRGHSHYYFEDAMSDTNTNPVGV